MIKLFTFVALLLSTQAFAQLSVQDTDGALRFKFLNKEYSTTFYSLAGIQTEKFNDESGRVGTYNYFTAGTYVGYNWRLTYRLPFTYGTAGTDRFHGERPQKSELLLQDFIIGLQNYNLLYLPWDMQLYWEGRIYLPTSEHARKTGMIARFRNNFILSKQFNKYFQVEFDQKLNYFAQSRSTYKNHFVDEEGFDVNTVSATKRTEFEHTLRFWGKIGESALGWAFQTEDMAWNESEADSRYRPGERYLHMGPSSKFWITKQANFIFQYEDVVDRDKNRHEFGQFLAKNTQFVLHSFIRF